MIMERFKTGTGIIFDARTLRDEVGLDIDEGIPTSALPERLSPGVLYLRKLSGAGLGGGMKGLQRLFEDCCEGALPDT